MRIRHKRSWYPVDALIVYKEGFESVENSFDHYILPLGTKFSITGIPLYAEAVPEAGVRIFTQDEFLQRKPKIKSIRRFNGSDDQRQEAIKRAISMIGHKYDFIEFNCESFANYVQYGRAYSMQVAKTVIGLIVALFRG